MIRTLFVLIGLAILPFVVSASSIGDKIPGYIVMDNGQKKEGEIVLGSLIDNEIGVAFIAKNQTARKTYSPKEIQGYAYQIKDIDDYGRKENRWVYYKRQKVERPPKPFGPTLVFMQTIEKGTVNLYSYFMQVTPNNTRRMTYMYYLELENDLLVAVEDNSFEWVAKSVFKDYPALANRIGKEDFLYRNLDKIVRDFNYWLVNKHDKHEYRVALKPSK